MGGRRVARGARLARSPSRGSRSLLLLLTWRPEDLDDLASAFAATVDALPSAVSVPLRRLDGDDVERLVAAASTMGGPSMAADALLEESEGLPLFVVEALAAGTSTVEGPTRSVRALLRERLATVSETAGQVLSAAAVIGRSFDLPLVRGASGRSEDETVTALEELVRRGIVREVPGGSGGRLRLRARQAPRRRVRRDQPRPSPPAPSSDRRAPPGRGRGPGRPRPPCPGRDPRACGGPGGGGG